MKTQTLAKPALAILTLSLGFGSIATSSLAFAEEQEKPHAIQTLYVDDPEAVNNEYIDLDQDGVADKLDHCPNTKFGAPVNTFGCELDSDGDGVYDRNDDCPNTPAGAKVNDRGCELDEDKDGVVDRLDKCPGTLSIFKVDKDGCPIVVLDSALFDFDSSELNSAELTKLQTSLGTLPALKANEVILVTGHTDNMGSEAYNLNLSWQRANTVKNYMTETANFDESTIWLDGKGESQPVAENDTEENRHQNRRVEVKVIPKDALPDNATTSLD
ncbi:MAG: OmpA family protein [Pseudomonadota bacterium]|nr:OmpA family protein [Pseudomonadota bacterium]